MNTSLVSQPTTRRRRKHSAEFKAQAIAACLQPGVSIAAVALANQLNANFLRSWVKAYRDQQSGSAPIKKCSDQGSDPGNCAPPKLVPVALQVADAQPSGDIQIEIRRQHTVSLMSVDLIEQIQLVTLSDDVVIVVRKIKQLIPHLSGRF